MGATALPRRAVVLAGLTGAALVATGLRPGFAGVAEATQGAEQAPEIIGCAGWAARPPARAVTVHDARPVKILVHHTATPNADDPSRGAADALARGIQNVHMDRRGWIDTGQHFTISRGGFVLEGRHRSLEALNGGRRMVEGAHCTGQNVVAVGIENEGLYDGVDPPPQLWDRLRSLCALICRRYGIRPTEIYGHRDFRNTICPGGRFYGQLPRLRAEVADELGLTLGGAEAVKASWPLLTVGDRGAPVLAAQHLLRGAGFGGRDPDGEFGPDTLAALRGFQHATGAEDATGVLGGESWPVLARTVRLSADAAAVRAVEVLAAERGLAAQSVPDEVTAAVWQELLGTGGAPADLRCDPPGTPSR